MKMNQLMELLLTICCSTDPYKLTEIFLLICGFLIMPRKMTWKNWKANTYRTWRAVIAVNDLGIVPERLLLLRRLSS
jgi:hypothetical protein